MNRQRYERLPVWAKKVVDEVGNDIRAKSFAVDADWMARQNKILDGKIKVYKPDEREIEQWYAGAPAAWVAVRGTYDKTLARRALEQQQQVGLIKKLEAAGAL